jgi:Na+/proline symporter
MQYLSIDYLIVYAFLAITLYIGLRTGRGAKDIQEYATANKMFGTGALVLTWLATDIAGETVLDMTHSVRTEGVIHILSIMGGWGIALLMQGLVFAPRFTNFPNCITLGDVMNELYKGPSQIITGVLASLTAICIAGMEITVLGLLSESLLGVDYRWGVGLGGALLVIYTVHGGMKAVTYTDVFQFLILIIILPIITIIALKHAGGLKQALTHVPISQFQILHHPKLGKYLALFLTLSVFQFSVIDPALIQRILMGRSKEQLRNQFFIISAVSFTVMLTLLILGLTSISILPNDTTEASIVLYLVNNILPIGLKGLAFAGLFAITMATFDSFLHAAGLTLVHDVIAPIYHRQGRELNELRLTRFITLLVGCIAIIVGSIRAEDLYNFVLISYQFTGPLLAFPLFAGVLGLKPDQYAFYIASAVTVVTLLLAKLLIPEEYQYMTSLISVITNGILFLGVHVIRNKGFAIVNHVQRRSYTWRPQAESWKSKLKTWLPTPQRIVRYSQRQVERYGAPYILLGLFGVINYVFPFYMWDHDTVAGYNLMLYIRVTAAMACGLLLVKDKWPTFLLPYLPTFWHLALCYCLPFTSTVMLLLTNFSVEWLVNIALSIMLLIVLVDWLTFFIIGILGIGLGLLFYRQVVGPIHIELNFSNWYLLVYQAIFATLIGLLFARRKEKLYDQLATDNRILAATEQETRQAHFETFIEKIRLIKTLKDADIQKLAMVVKEIRSMRSQAKRSSSSIKSLDRDLQTIETDIASVALALTRVEHRALDYMRLEVKPVSIEQLLEQLQHQLSNYTLHYSRQSQQEKMVCDPIQLIKVLKNTIITLSSSDHSRQNNYHIVIQDTYLTYPLPKVNPQGDHIRRIPAIRLIISQQADQVSDLPDSYTPDMSSSSLPNPANEQAFLLATNQRIIKAHYGYTNVDVSKQDAYDYYLYVIPVDVTEIRPPDMNALHRDLGVALVRAND